MSRISLLQPFTRAIPGWCFAVAWFQLQPPGGR